MFNQRWKQCSTKPYRETKMIGINIFRKDFTEQPFTQNMHGSLHLLLLWSHRIRFLIGNAAMEVGAGFSPALLLLHMIVSGSFAAARISAPNAMERLENYQEQRRMDRHITLMILCVFICQISLCLCGGFPKV